MMMQLSAHSATRKAIAGALAALTLAVSGCANSYGVGTASSRSLGQASTVYTGVVTSPYFAEPTSARPPRRIEVGMRVGF